MSTSTNIEPISELKKRTAELVERAERSQSPLVITRNGRAAAVLQDIASFKRQRDALLLLKMLAQGEQAHREGRNLSPSAMRRRIGKRLKRLEQGE